MTGRRAGWLIALILVVAAIGGWLWWREGPKPVPVQMATVTREDLQAKVTANGKVQAQKKVDISATIAGQVTHLAVREGDAVRKEQFLLQIDPTTHRAMARSSEFSMKALLEDLAAARSSHEQARADAERAGENFRAGILPAAELERASTAVATSGASLAAAQRRVDQARATLEGAQDTLSKTTVRSPIDGIVTAKRVEEGEVAVIGVQNSPGTVLLTISDMSVVESEMEVDETSIPTVDLGQEALIRIDAYPNRTFEGVVTEVGNSPILSSSPQSEAIKFKVKIRIKNPPEGIKPGLTVQADILTGFRAKTLTVPIQALVLREIERKAQEVPKRGDPRDQEGVWIVDGGRVRFQPLKTGLLGEMSMEVTEGLSGGETIVTGPFRVLRSLKSGDAVRPEQPSDRSSTP